MPQPARPLAVTMGEPAGIGPDVIVAAWHERKTLKLPPFVVIGDATILARRALAMGLPLATAAYEPGDGRSPFSSALPVISVSEPMQAEPGLPQSADAKLVIEAIRMAVDMARSGKAAGVVTAPISKAALYRDGFQHPGHTEFLAELSKSDGTEAPLPVMMIASDHLRTVPVTIHEPLEAVPKLLSRELIERSCRIVDADLRSRFGLAKPRLAVAGLNPHAGEDGALGAEDKDIIAPAIHQLQSEGIDARGPLPADTMFHAKARAGYDVAICMYHDQALIPAKTLAFEQAVNVTLGLPFIRTSPDHGTAFDIAGSGKADPTSFVEALNLAAALAAQEAIS